ncbi:hypothetical protein [Wolbachia endosymbiont (group A) of Lasioglossum morio]|uniref:hypothetical protein n=1 Tax=Wolbachia endosymbiont (group A) of Lasioglossum morio TaxID=2954025 RepID=UPI002227E2D0|nr:hypothetical protein [Wolbachia endosymbiont (group A) of Lasioglossum morio]
MPNTKETVRALVSAFNVNNYDFNAVKTNFTLQSDGKNDYIVVSFDKGMGKYQRSRYLDSIKRKIVGEFYSIEEGDTDEVVLNTANLIFNIESFPFNTSTGEWSQDEQGRVEFLAPIDDGVIFNLKSHLASSLVKDVLEDMPTCSIVTNSFNKEKYLCHSKFPNKKLRKEFEHEFLSRMKARYENVPKDPLKVEGNSVYIKDVFDDVRFIDSITRRAAWRIGIDLGIGNDVDHSVMLLKDSIINSVYQSTKTIVVGFMCASPLNRKEASILIPIMQNCRGARFLTNEEAGNINHKFNNAVLNDLDGRTQAELSTNGSSGIYGIDFSNKEISHCVITKIIKNSVINKDHELAIDPELRFRALSRSPSTELLDMKLESPTCSQGVALKDSPRQGSEREEKTEPSLGVLREEIGQASTSSLRAWDSSTFLNLEGSNKESEKQQVTDKSDRKSSDECSKAKPQDSKSPEKKHGGGWRCSKRKSDGVTSLFRQNNKGRGSVCSISSSLSAPGGSVPEKLPVSESSSSFPGRIKAKSNPPSAVTSPTHEGVPEWQQRLNPDQREELRPFLSPELRKKLDSNSLSPEDEQLKHLLYTPEGKRELSRSLCESQELQLRRLAEAQLSSPDNSNRDSGFSSMGSPASPVVQHKGSAPLKVTECSVQQVNSHSVERT